MDPDLTSDERLLRRALQLAEPAEPAEHPDEEALAQFALGELAEPGRAAMVQHLAECGACRQAAGLLMSLREEESRPRPVPRILVLFQSRGFRRGLLAASLLVGIGLVVLAMFPRQAPEQLAHDRAAALLQTGQFAEARRVLADAAARGIHSDRLRSLEAQAIRQMPNPSALALAGRLTDFGFGIGGVVARQPGNGDSLTRLREAYKVLALSDTEDPQILLNRGHVLLALGRPEEAMADFRKMVAQDPSSAMGQLGQGLAYFMQEEYPAAEQAFQECLRLEPGNASARINLAMTLEEEEKWAQALTAWQAVPRGALSSQERGQVNSQIEAIQRLLQKQ